MAAKPISEPSLGAIKKVLSQQKTAQWGDVEQAYALAFLAQSVQDAVNSDAEQKDKREGFKLSFVQAFGQTSWSHASNLKKRLIDLGLLAKEAALENKYK